MTQEFLKSVFLFRELDDDEMGLIMEMFREGSFEDGEVILKEGTPGRSLYVIHDGKVQISRRFESESFVLTELGSGDFFGEMSLIDDFPTSASVSAVGKTRVLQMDRKDFKSLILENTRLSSKMWEALARSLNTKIRQTDHLVQLYYGLNKALCENEQFRELYTYWNFSTPKPE